MKYFSMPVFTLFKRGLSAIYNYLIIRLLSVSEYGAFSNFISVVNNFFQIGKLSYEYEFQKLLHDKESEEDSSHINTIFFIIGVCLSVPCSIISFITIRFFYQETSFFETSFFAFFIFTNYLFMVGIFVTKMYAKLNIKAMIFFMFVSIFAYSFIYFCNFVLGYKEQLLNVHSFILFLSILITFIIFFKFQKIKISFFEIGNVFRSAIEKSLPIYLNNSSIAIVQIIIIGIISYQSIELIAGYRVIQSIQSIIAMIPISLSIFWINKSFRDSGKDEFILMHFYLIIGLGILQLEEYIIYLYPKYDLVIANFLALFFLLNTLTVLSNSIIFSNYENLRLRRYLKLLPLIFIANILICFNYQINNLKDMIVLDWIIQINFFICILVCVYKNLSLLKYRHLLNYLFISAIFLLSIFMEDILLDYAIKIIILISIMYVFFSYKRITYKPI